MAVVSPFRNWLNLKLYQFEVTLSVYMYTSGEKFAFYSITFLLCGLTFIAAVLYLPQHVASLAGRAWYYINGELAEAVHITSVLLNETGGAASKATTEAAETVMREL